MLAQPGAHQSAIKIGSYTNALQWTFHCELACLSSVLEHEQNCLIPIQLALRGRTAILPATTSVQDLKETRQQSSKVITGILFESVCTVGKGTSIVDGVKITDSLFLYKLKQSSEVKSGLRCKRKIRRNANRERSKVGIFWEARVEHAKLCSLVCPNKR